MTKTLLNSRAFTDKSRILSKFGIMIKRISLKWVAVIAAFLSFFPSLTLAPSISAGKTEGIPATYSYTLPVQASWQVDLFGSW